MKAFQLILRQMGPLVVLCCLVCLGGAAAAQGQERFENGFPPPSWTYYGLNALGGVADSTSGIAPTDGTHFGWISVGCVGAAGTTCPAVATAPTPGYASLGLGSGGSLGTPTKETFLMSPSFTLAAPTTISFDVNFITTDGTDGFADFALVQLIPSTGSAINLFVANTTCDGCQAVPAAQLNPPDPTATLSPATATFSSQSVTFGATTYGNVPKFGSTIDKGGPTGWIHVTYPALAGTYTLRFYVSHVGDTNYPSALAIDNIVGPPFMTTPVVTDGTHPTTVIFNSNTDQVVRHDVVFAAAADMTFPLGPSSSLQMQSINRLLSNSTDWPPYVSGTPFAISHLLVHAGDNAAAGGTDIGSKYEDECFDATHPPAPNQCPYPNSPTIHIRAKDVFDFPKDTSGTPNKPPIDFGTTASFIHYYQNTIPALTAWSSSGTSPNPVCTSVTNAPSAFTCDLEDILVNIYGDPLYGSDTKRGSYASVYNVPMLLSAVKVNGTSVNAPGVQGSSTFFVHQPLTFDFLVTPAQCPVAQAPCGNGWKAAPVNNLFYTFDPLASAPDYPGTTDLNDLTNCPGPNCMATGAPGASSTLPVEFTTTPAMPAAEGQYLLQWSAADTVRIRERNVQLLTAAGPPCPNPFGDSPAPVPPCYSTKLFNAQIVVDNTPPTITITTPANNAVYVLNQIVKASYGCTDASGVASGSPTGTVPSGSNIDTASVGVKTFTVTCTDVAGNVSTTSVTYTVVSYNASVQQPINSDGSSVFNASRGVIPVKFSLALNGAATCALPAATIVVTRTAGGTIGAIDESTYDMAADNGSNFRISSCQYIYNLAAKSLGPGTYRVDILINGVVVGSGVFALK